MGNPPQDKISHSICKDEVRGHVDYVEIGRVWKRCEAWSLPVLIPRGFTLEACRKADEDQKINDLRCRVHASVSVSISFYDLLIKNKNFLVAMVLGKHPIPFRTRKLSPDTPMVLRGQLRGRVGCCQDHNRPKPKASGGSTLGSFLFLIFPVRFL